ncbi:hypothetical protein K435DRAFT_864360 [Dendrothele bispora CBS 962.96]|uniref:Uncharacterized protein n=1 Tax=Dendrothele bispora (strain CBS 962.96) TaxID=1314807 RepID=A0A4S8LMP4_DENBC|nr:hypothetical protein K435DRAFT_864360 [Dendrothele bispora CBS 962.96]
MSPCDQTVPKSFTLPVVVTRTNSYIWPAELPLARGDFDSINLELNPSNFFNFLAAERARAHQMARVYTSNTARLDDDARHLTQDYPAVGDIDNLSRASSRSSTVSQASRSAYPGVPEEILERISQAKSARLAARARYEAALNTRDPSHPVILELEDQLSKIEDELKFARIERTRAKVLSRHASSPSKSPLSPPLPVPSPARHSSQPPLQPVHESLAPFLQGEELRYRSHGTSVYEDKPWKTADKLKLAGTERDHVELASQDSATLPRSLLSSILASPLPQIATRFSSQPVLEDLAPFLEQREDPSNRRHRDDAEDQRSQVANELKLTRTEHDRAELSGQWGATLSGLSERRDRSKLLDQHVAPRWSTPSPQLLSPMQPRGFEYLAPSLERGGESRKPMTDFDRGVSFKAGEEVEVMGGREEKTRSVHDVRAQLPRHYEHEGRSRTIVPLDREQHMYVPNVSRTATRPVQYHNASLTPVIQQWSELGSNEQRSGVYHHSHAGQPSRNQDEREVQHCVPPTMNTHPQEQLGVNSPPPPINYISRPRRSSPFLVTTSTRGVSSSWPRPRNFGTPVQHIVGGFGGGGDPEGSSYYESSESGHGGGNGGGGRRPGWWDDDPGDPDRNDKERGGDRQPRRGRHGPGKDRSNEPRRGSCGGGPPGGDPPDDGEPEGDQDGNSERSSRKDLKKRRGMTPFSEIPEEGSPHYDYEYFEYKVKSPTNSKKPLKEKVFTRFATLIEWRLFTKMQVLGDSKAQRNLVNSIPKIKQYNGQNSIIVLDNFLRGLIRHMEIQGLTGPEKREDSEGTLVVTNEDAGRTILMAGNLTGAALEWYQKYAERPPDSFKQDMKASAHRRTFLQIFRALFDRFITGAALKEIDTLYDKVKYTTLGGIRQLFSDMKMYAKLMPVPPDEYRFKDNLLEKLPQSMRRIALNDGLGPNTATIDEIMQRALAVESGWEAEAYYNTTGSQLNVSESETDTGGESESEETQEGGGSAGTRQQRLLKSWLKTQAN